MPVAPWLCFPDWSGFCRVRPSPQTINNEDIVAATTFDALKFAKTLEAAGTPTAQGEAVVEAFRDATKEELVTRPYLDARLADLRAELHKSQAELKTGLIKWMAGALGYG